SSRSRRSRGLLPSPDSAPACAALRHSAMWEVYRPSRRRISPRPERSAASYSARIAALNSAVNVRLLGRSARGAMAQSSAPTSATVIVISMCPSLAPCEVSSRSAVVSHPILTHRDPPAPIPATTRSIHRCHAEYRAAGRKARRPDASTGIYLDVLGGRALRHREPYLARSSGHVE